MAGSEFPLYHHDPLEELHEQLIAERQRADAAEAREKGLREALLRHRGGLQNILEFRKITLWGFNNAGGEVRYGALTREEVEASVAEIDAVLGGANGTNTDNRKDCHLQPSGECGREVPTDAVPGDSPGSERGRDIANLGVRPMGHTPEPSLQCGRTGSRRAEPEYVGLADPFSVNCRCGESYTLHMHTVCPNCAAYPALGRINTQSTPPVYMPSAPEEQPAERKISIREGAAMASRVLLEAEERRRAAGDDEQPAGVDLHAIMRSCEDPPIGFHHLRFAELLGVDLRAAVAIRAALMEQPAGGSQDA
jgi:hypothetical protein